MQGVDQQIRYWQRGSRQDLLVGKLLLRQRKTRHGLFFLHLAMEKLLKALVCKATRRHAPRIHSLALLAERAGAAIDNEQAAFLARFDRFNLAGRYPDDLTPIPRSPQARKLAVELEKVYQCLRRQL